MTHDEFTALVNADYEVKTTSGATRMQSELTAAFNLVAPKPNWKMPIDVTIRNNVNHTLIKDAVIHFTGSTPHFTTVGRKLRVQAAGYYAAIGA